MWPEEGNFQGRMCGEGAATVPPGRTVDTGQRPQRVQEGAWAGQAWTTLPLSVSVLMRSRADLAQPRGTWETIWPKQVDRET